MSTREYSHVSPQNHLYKLDLYCRKMQMFIDFEQLELLKKIFVSLNENGMIMVFNNHSTTIHDELEVRSVNEFIQLAADAFYESFKNFYFISEQVLNISLDIFSENEKSSARDFLVRIPFKFGYVDTEGLPYCHYDIAVDLVFEDYLYLIQNDNIIYNHDFPFNNTIEQLDLSYTAFNDETLYDILKITGNEQVYNSYLDLKNPNTDTSSNKNFGYNKVDDDIPF